MHTLSPIFIVVTAAVLITGCSNPYSVENDDAQPAINNTADESTIADETLSESLDSAPLLREEGDHYLLGGDIIINKNDPEHQELIASLLPAHLGKSEAMQYVVIPIWPKGIVKYTLSGFTESEKKVIQSSMKILADAANVTFTLTAQNAAYVYKIAKLKSTSFGGVSTIGYTAQPSCQLVTITQATCVHEFMHCLGFGHEHQRYDRNSYVTINTANITAGFLDQFQIVPKETAYKVTTITGGKVTTSTKTTPYSRLVTGYDYLSIMHYPATAFAKKSGLVTIAAKNANYAKTLGTATTLSAGDKSALVALYGKKK